MFNSPRLSWVNFVFLLPLTFLTSCVCVRERESRGGSHGLSQGTGEGGGGVTRDGAEETVYVPLGKTCMLKLWFRTVWMFRRKAKFGLKASVVMTGLHLYLTLPRVEFSPLAYMRAKLCVSLAWCWRYCRLRYNLLTRMGILIEKLAVPKFRLFINKLIRVNEGQEFCMEIRVNFLIFVSIESAEVVKWSYLA